MISKKIFFSFTLVETLACYFIFLRETSFNEVRLKNAAKLVVNYDCAIFVPLDIHVSP